MPPSGINLARFLVNGGLQRAFMQGCGREIAKLHLGGRSPFLYLMSTA